MNKLLYAAALTGCLTSPIANATSDNTEANTTVKDRGSLENRAYCNLAVSSALNQFKWILENWISRKDSPWHVENNFNRLKQENEKRFAHILRVADIGLSPIDSIKTLKEKMRLLDVHQAESLIVFTDVRAANDEFEMSLFALEGAMADLNFEIENLQGKCSFHKENLHKITNHLLQYQKVVNTYRTYVYQSSIKAENLYLIVIELAKAELYKSYINKTTERLEDVQRLIHDALRLDALYTEFSVWWQYTSAKVGIGGGLHRKYLMYATPLMKMQEQLNKANEILSKVSSEVKPSSSKDRVLAEISHAISLIQAEISGLEAVGWEGQRDRQIQLNQYRAQRVAIHDCQTFIKRHQKKAREATSMSEFKLVSQYYLVAVDACDKEAKL